jgi:hypothetical protein
LGPRNCIGKKYFHTLHPAISPYTNRGNQSCVRRNANDPRSRYLEFRYWARGIQQVVDGNLESLWSMGEASINGQIGSETEIMQMLKVYDQRLPYSFLSCHNMGSSKRIIIAHCVWISSVGNSTVITVYRNDWCKDQFR